jgi:ABC-type antimicrobial peptide transport system permease subunit
MTIIDSEVNDGKSPNDLFLEIFMFKNYLKIALRNLFRQKVYSFINISGLAVGMACFILILLWVQDELRYDRFHENIEYIYRVLDYEKYSNGEELYFTSNPAVLGPILKEEYPEILEFTRFTRGRNIITQYGGKRFNDDGFAFADPSFFRLFTFPLVEGNEESVFSDPYSLVISEEAAGKYFGDENPIGKTIQIDNRLDFKISGVAKDIPSNSHLQFKFLAPFTTIKEFGGKLEGWNSFAYATYILLDRNADYREVSRKIEDVVRQRDEKSIVSLSLQSIKDVHLYSSHIWGLGGDGDVKYVYIFSIIAIFILLTACINFMNLATARSARRAKEVGLRKVAGAARKEIIFQFLGESILIAFIALAFSIALVDLMLPFFNSLSGKQLVLPIGGNFTIIMMMLGTVIGTGIIAGSYPALFLSAFQPVTVLKGPLNLGVKGSAFRKILVSFQFVLTIVLIIGTLVFNRQLHFIRNQKLGFNEEHVLSITLKGNLTKKTDFLKNELMRSGDVVSVSAVSDLPTRIRTSAIVDEWEGRDADEQYLSHLFYADQDFLKTMQTEMVQGRFFSEEFATDTASGVVINEAALRIMGMNSPIGKNIFENREIIGVIKDFHFRSFHDKISPLVIGYSDRDYRYLMVKLKPGDMTRAVNSLESTWNSVAPEFPLEFQFFDEHIDMLYRADRRIEKIVNVFTVLALFIACLGLFGLVSFVAGQRTKEIGIRKVLGASIPGIFVLLSKEFMKWVLIANIIAWPIAYYFMNKWLSGFAYRIELTIWLFVISGGFALVIALATVSYQAIKAAVANPVESLRYE